MEYHPIITHDVDRYYKWKSYRALAGEFSRKIKGQSHWSLSEMLNSFYNRNQKDPFSNLRLIAEMDSEVGLDSVFYIMTTDINHDLNINDYSIKDPEVIEDIKYIKTIGAEIGIHFGITTYNNKTEMLKQKNTLENIVKDSVVRSRQHYLKYEYPKTFKYLSEIGIQNDSSILVDEPLSREKYYTTYSMMDDHNNLFGISQTPLVFMDTHHMDKSDNEILKELESSLEIPKKKGGEVMILWHNNNISNKREINLYRNALKVIQS